MTLVDHLVELRNRLVKAIIAVAIGSVVGFWFWRDIRNVLIAPLPSGTVQVLGPGDAFVIALRISIITGIILAMPVLLYQIWAFVAPGLTVPERKMVRPWIPLALLFFALGVGDRLRHPAVRRRLPARASPTTCSSPTWRPDPTSTSSPRCSWPSA